VVCGDGVRDHAAAHRSSSVKFGPVQLVVHQRATKRLLAAVPERGGTAGFVSVRSAAAQPGHGVPGGQSSAPAAAAVRRVRRPAVAHVPVFASQVRVPVSVVVASLRLCPDQVQSVVGRQEQAERRARGGGQDQVKLLGERNGSGG